MSDPQIWLCSYVSVGVATIFMWLLIRTPKPKKKAMKPFIIKKV